MLLPEDQDLPPVSPPRGTRNTAVIVVAKIGNTLMSPGTHLIPRTRRCATSRSYGNHGTLSEYFGKIFPQAYVASSCDKKKKGCVYPCKQAGAATSWRHFSGSARDSPGPNWTRDHVFLSFVLEITEGKDDRPEDMFQSGHINNTDNSTCVAGAFCACILHILYYWVLLCLMYVCMYA